MPPACPVDIYVRRYKTAAHAHSFFPFSGDGGAVAGKWEEWSIIGVADVA
jgi:hypothetical protein